MNKQRTWFQLPPDSHKYLITPYWLLGFVEGEGSFSIHPRDLVLTFSITQSIIDLSLMEAIKYFSPPATKKKNLVFFWLRGGGEKVSKASQQDKCQIKIADASYIRVELIPFFHRFFNMAYQESKGLSRLKNHIKNNWSR